MIFDQPNIAQILKKYLHESFSLYGIGTNELIEDLGLNVVDEIEFEAFICNKFRLGSLYVNLNKIRTFGDLVKHIYLMRFYRSVIRRELTAGIRFHCLIGDGYTYELFQKKPSFLRYFKAYLRGERFIFADILG